MSSDHITHLVQPAPAEAASDHVMHVAPKRPRPRRDASVEMLGGLLIAVLTVGALAAIAILF